MLDKTNHMVERCTFCHGNFHLWVANATPFLTGMNIQLVSNVHRISSTPEIVRSNYETTTKNLYAKADDINLNTRNINFRCMEKKVLGR